MKLTYDSYISALSAFYQAALVWKNANDANSETKDTNLKLLKEKAKILQEELKKLPSSMVRPMVLEHIEKALNL